MQSVQLKISNVNGFHARPGATFVKACKQFSSKVTVEKGGQAANAKSLMKVLTLGIVQGDEITIHTEGEDEKVALEQLKFVVETLEG